MTNQQGANDKGTTLDYYALLGVSQDASLDEIEGRYREISEHMASPAMPPSLREWARRETALLDEAYAVLSDPERRAGLTLTPAPAAHAAAAPAAAQPQPAPRTAGESHAPPERPASALKALFNGVPWTLAALGAALGIVVLAFLLGGRDILSGRGSDDTSAAQQTDQIGIDTARVSELVGLVQEDPNNLEALFELGETYFLGEEWQAAIDWFTRVLALDPGNVHALTDVGTSNFNLGRPEEARTAWLAGLAAAPDDPQLHYNMGFLYANVEPVDFQSAMAEWQKVVDLSPGSDLAATAQVHLDSLVAQADAGTTPAAGEPTIAPPAAEATAAP